MDSQRFSIVNPMANQIKCRYSADRHQLNIAPEEPHPSKAQRVYQDGHRKYQIMAVPSVLYHLLSSQRMLVQADPAFKPLLIMSGTWNAKSICPATIAGARATIHNHKTIRMLSGRSPCSASVNNI